MVSALMKRPMSLGSVGCTLISSIRGVSRHSRALAMMWGIAFEDLATLNGWTLEENGVVPEWPGVGATIHWNATTRTGTWQASALAPFPSLLTTCL